MKSDGNKMSYLLLHLAVTPYIYPRSSKSLVAAKKAASNLGIKLFTICVDNDGYPSLTGAQRYFFRFPNFRRDDKLASRFADAVLVAMAVTFEPFLHERGEVSSFRIPANLIKNRKSVYLGELTKVEEKRLQEERITDLPTTLIGSFVQFPEHAVERAWKLTPLLFNYERFLRAFRFIKTSQENFWVWPSQFDSASEEANKAAENIYQQSRLENALQDSFKAIEAILGDPPKDDEKFFRKIKSIGLDPNMEYGSEAKPIYQVIREMNEARDRKAAHGSTPNRLITAGELLAYQSCARFIVLKASELEVEHRL